VSFAEYLLYSILNKKNIEQSNYASSGTDGFDGSPGISGQEDFNLPARNGSETGSGSPHTNLGGGGGNGGNIGAGGSGSEGTGGAAHVYIIY